MHKFRPQNGGHFVDILFTLALFCVFAASAMMVVLIGANVYQSTVHSMDVNFNMGTSLTYVSNKIRQNDTSGAVYVENVEGTRALVLETTWGEDVFQTWIFHTDGALREVLVRKGEPVALSDGLSVLEVESFDIHRLSDTLYSLNVFDEDGNASNLMIYVRTE